MINLRKTFHTLLGFPDSDERRDTTYRCRYSLPPEGGGLRFLAGDELSKPPNVVESSNVGSVVKPPPERTDPGSWGLHDAEGDGVGFCTESLGSESCEGGMGLDVAEIGKERSRQGCRKIKRSRRWRREEAKFPPPLPWLSRRDGRRSCFMKGERKDGRFLLTEVTIERPEVLRASRQNGRLRLELVRSEIEEIEENEEEEEEKIEEVDEVKEDIIGGESGDRWELPTMRCQAVTGDRFPLWWNHRFVTTA